MENMKTVVGLFDGWTQAQGAVNELLNSGCQRDAINIMASDDERQRWMGEEKGYVDEGAGRAMGKYSFLSGGSSSLIDLGIEEQDAQFYAEGVNRGGFLVAVSTDASNAQRIADILNRFGAIDIDQRRAMQPSYTPGREEVPREPRYVSREAAETPVVTGETRVKEDVSVTSQSLEQGQVVRDTAQRSDLPDVSRMDDDEFMRHFTSTYGQRGERFDESYRSAYCFAEAESSSHPEFSDKEWFEVEEEIHRDWERTHPGTWIKMQEAIHFGWDRTHRHH